MAQKTYTLDELMAQDEPERIARLKAELAAEQAAWDALSPEEKAAKIASYESKWEQGDPDEVDGGDEDEDEDADEEDE